MAPDVAGAAGGVLNAVVAARHAAEGVVIIPSGQNIRRGGEYRGDGKGQGEEDRGEHLVVDVDVDVDDGLSDGIQLPEKLRRLRTGIAVLLEGLEAQGE